MVERVSAALQLPPDAAETERIVEGLLYLMDGVTRPGVDPTRARDDALRSTIAFFEALASTAPVTFVWWSILGFVFAAILSLGNCRGDARREQMATARSHVSLLVLLAVTTGLMQYSTLVTFTAAPVASALALCQLSSLVNVLLGHHFFGAPHVVRRLIGSAVMAAGAVLIVLDR